MLRTAVVAGVGGARRGRARNTDASSVASGEEDAMHGRGSSAVTAAAKMSLCGSEPTARSQRSRSRLLWQAGRAGCCGHARRCRLWWCGRWRRPERSGWSDGDSGLSCRQRDNLARHLSKPLLGHVRDRVGCQELHDLVDGGVSIVDGAHDEVDDLIISLIA